MMEVTMYPSHAECRGIYPLENGLCPLWGSGEEAIAVKAVGTALIPFIPILVYVGTILQRERLLFCIYQCI